MSSSWLLVSDLDDTLTGDAAALARLVGRLQSTDIALVVTSSRPVDSVRPGLGALGLPVRGIVGALGTQVDWNGTPDTAWEAQFAGFPRSDVSAVLRELGPAHEPQFQAPAKVSHAVPRERWSQARSGVGRLAPGLRVVTSGDSNVDVIPVAAGKTAAARYVARRLGVPWARVLTAGDAEIDAGMLLAAKGICVGNATSALRRELAGRAYQAAGLHANGVLEGLVHYGADTEGPHHG